MLDPVHRIAHDTNLGTVNMDYRPSVKLVNHPHRVDRYPVVEDEKGMAFA